MKKKLKGMFILTGSHQMALHQAVSQSLAGRTALLYLLPLSLNELRNAGFNLSLDEFLYRGGYPRVFSDTLNPTKAYRNYLQTYIEKDLRQLIHLKDLSQFQNFFHLLGCVPKPFFYRFSSSFEPLFDLNDKGHIT